MKFSVALKILLPDVPVTNWNAINNSLLESANRTAQHISEESLKISMSTQNAAWSQACATWLQAVASLGALFAAIWAARSTWEALQTWRSQVVGEQEFSRLVKAIQALQDIESTISNVRRSSNGYLPHKVRDFVVDIREFHREFLRETVGIDIIWNAQGRYEPLKNCLQDLVNEIALAAEEVVKNIPNKSNPKYHALVNFASPTYLPNDLKVLESDVKKAEIRIRNDIEKMRCFLKERLQKYVKK